MQAANDTALTSLVPVQVVSVTQSSLSPMRAIQLREEVGERTFHIVVGVPEADAIALKLGGGMTNRPMTHDLTISLTGAAGARIERVAIDRLEGDTFFASVHLHAGSGRSVQVDSRPSDALNIALRTGVPILAAESLFIQANASPKDLMALDTFLASDVAARLSTSARSALTRAGDEARALRHSYTGTEHLLLALLHDAEGAAGAMPNVGAATDPSGEVSSAASKALAAAGITLETARAELQALVPVSDAPTDALVVTPRLKQLVERVAEEADRAEGQTVAVEDLLLALTADTDSLASKILATLKTKQLRTELRQALAPHA